MYYVNSFQSLVVVFPLFPYRLYFKYENRNFRFILGFKDYKNDAEAVLNDCKAVAAKRRRQSTRLENLGIPEEELLRQQQELFAKAREEQAAVEQAQWMMAAVQQSTEAMHKQMKSQLEEDSDDDEY